MDPQLTNGWLTFFQFLFFALVANFRNRRFRVKTWMFSFSGKSERSQCQAGVPVATFCQGWVVVAKWAGHLLSTPPADRVRLPGPGR